MDTKRELTKQGCVARFTLTGKVRITEKTFELDTVSKSGFQYNRMNIGIDCGPEYGTIYANAFGGINDEVIFFKENERVSIDWNDRFDEDILKETSYGSLFIFNNNGDEHRFLSGYDFISYAEEHLEDGMTVYVSGNIKYDYYNGNVYLKRNINRIYTREYTPDKFKAEFTQTIFVNKDSIADKDLKAGVITVQAYVFEKLKEYNGWDLTEEDSNGLVVPLLQTYEYEFDPEGIDKNTFKKRLAFLFAPKKGYTKITFHGCFKGGGTVIKPSVDELPDDIKEAIAMGVYTEEEALAECADNTSGENRMVLIRPTTDKIEGKDGASDKCISRYPNEYSEKDFDLIYLREREDEDEDLSDVFSDDELDDLFDDDDDIPFDD